MPPACWSTAALIWLESSRSSASERAAGRVQGTEDSRAPRTAEAVAVGFVAPELIALGREDAVRRIIDLSVGDRTREEHHRQPGNDAADPRRSGQHGVGRRPLREIAAACAFPRSGQQVPPLRLVSAKANVNGGIRATVRAEAGDEAAAEQLRDVVRGFVSLARLQSGGKAGVRQHAQVDRTVRHRQNRQLSFAMSPEALRASRARAPPPRRSAGSPAARGHPNQRSKPPDLPDIVTSARGDTRF